MRKTIILTTLFLIFVAFVNSSPAIEVPLLGPVQYIRSAGKPDVYTGTFYGLTGEAKVIVHNGDENGNHRVSSALVFLNGQQVFGPHDFNQQVSILEATVNLDSKNMISVELRSKPESLLTIHVVQDWDVEVNLDETNSVGTVITANGGMLETTALGTHFKLTLPPNALIDGQEITLTPVMEIAGLPLASGMLAAVKVGPEGLRLLKPAILTIELPDPPPDDLVGFLCQENGEGFHLYPMQRSENTLSFSLMHFSLVGAASGPCGDIVGLDDPNWLTLEQRAKNQIAVLEAYVSRCNQGYLDYAHEILLDIHLDWFYGTGGGVYELLLEAQSDPDNFLKRAINQLHAWYLSLIYDPFVSVFDPLNEDFTAPFTCEDPNDGLCENLDDVADAAGVLIEPAFENAVIEANNSCIASGPSQDDRNALGWLGLLSMMDIEGWRFYENIDIDELFDLKTCGIRSVEIDPPEKTLKEGDSALLKAIAKDENGNKLPSQDFYDWYWRSYNESIAEVDQNGTVRGVDEGTTLVCAILTSPALIQVNALDVFAVITVASGYTVTWSTNFYFYKEILGGYSTFAQNWQGEATVDSDGNVTVVSNDAYEQVVGYSSLACDPLICGGVGCVGKRLWDFVHIKTITDAAADSIISSLSTIVEYTGPDGRLHIDDPFEKCHGGPAGPCGPLLPCPLYAVNSDYFVEWYSWNGCAGVDPLHYTRYDPDGFICFILPSGPLTSDDGGHSFSKTGIAFWPEGPCEWSISIIKNP